MAIGNWERNEHLEMQKLFLIYHDILEREQVCMHSVLHCMYKLYVCKLYFKTVKNRLQSNLPGLSG